jgi:predicted 3-demethylubiquinone-9 3-methyltransferase (glyoxalase superfamily)
MFPFTPSMSLFVDCESEAELDAAFGKRDHPALQFQFRMVPLPRSAG